MIGRENTYNKEFNTYRINGNTYVRHHISDNTEGKKSYWDNFNKRMHKAFSGGIKWDSDWQDYSEYLHEHEVY